MRGVDLRKLEAECGKLTAFVSSVEESVRDGLFERNGEVIRLTARGKMLSNEVFARFISAPVPGI